MSAPEEFCLVALYKCSHYYYYYYYYYYLGRRETAFLATKCGPV